MLAISIVQIKETGPWEVKKKKKKVNKETISRFFLYKPSFLPFTFKYLVFYQIWKIQMLFLLCESTSCFSLGETRGSQYMFEYTIRRWSAANMIQTNQPSTIKRKKKTVVGILKQECMYITMVIPSSSFHHNQAKKKQRYVN